MRLGKLFRDFGDFESTSLGDLAEAISSRDVFSWWSNPNSPSNKLAVQQFFDAMRLSIASAWVRLIYIIQQRRARAPAFIRTGCWRHVSWHWPSFGRAEKEDKNQLTWKSQAWWSQSRSSLYCDQTVIVLLVWQESQYGNRIIPDKKKGNRHIDRLDSLVDR
jgi:hypothetical protein